RSIARTRTVWVCSWRRRWRHTLLPKFPSRECTSPTRPGARVEARGLCHKSHSLVSYRTEEFRLLEQDHEQWSSDSLHERLRAGAVFLPTGRRTSGADTTPAMTAGPSRYIQTCKSCLYSRPERLLVEVAAQRHGSGT